MIKELGKGKARLIVSFGSYEKGNRLRKTKTVEYRTKRELNRLYAEFEEEVRLEWETEPKENFTVDKLLRSYIAKKRLLGTRETTLVGYDVCRRRFIGSLSEVPADSLTTYQLEDFIAEKAENGFSEGITYSTKTLANTIGLLSAAYEDAIRSGRLEKNPCKNVTLPKRTSKGMLVFSEGEIRRFLGALTNERIDLRLGYELCLLCGLRRSETLGLKPEDVDLEKEQISIVRSRHRVSGEVIEEEPKTARSRRTLAIPDIIVRDFEAMFKLRESFPYCKCDYIIQDGFGKALNPATFTNKIHEIEEKAGLPPVTVHGLRHTFASMLNSEQVDVARISAELGHSNITTTNNVYIHVFGSATDSSRGIADTLNTKFPIPATLLPQIAK